MSNNKSIKELERFLNQQFPATIGNIELIRHLCVIADEKEVMQSRIASLTAACKAFESELREILKSYPLDVPRWVIERAISNHNERNKQS